MRSWSFSIHESNGVTPYTTSEYATPRDCSSLMIYVRIVSSMTRLAQHLTGLRSGCTLQRTIMQHRNATVNLSAAEPPSPSLKQPNQGDAFTNELAVFNAFEQHVGPSLRTLTHSCRRSLREMRSAFLHSRAGEKSAGHTHDDTEWGTHEPLIGLRSQLKQQLAAFKLAHGRAVRRLYRHHPSQTQHSNTAYENSNKPAIDTTNPNEPVLCVFFFLFNIEEFVNELFTLIEAFVKIRAEEEELEAQQIAAKQKYGAYFGSLFVVYPKSQKGKKRQHLKTLLDRLYTLVPSAKPSGPFPDLSSVAETRERTSTSASTLYQHLQRRLWNFGLTLRAPDIKFAIKSELFLLSW